jgi:aminopeptidase N
MLRKRMGDDRFFQMLKEACRRYGFKEMSTEDFRRLAQEFMPKESGGESLESFFESWVYGTGIPTLKLSSSIKGKAPASRLTVTVSQSDVDEEFTADVPVVVQFARGAPVTRWVRTSNEPTTVNIPVKQAPLKVAIGTGVLAVRK